MDRNHLFLVAPRITSEFFDVELPILEKNFEKIYIITEMIYDNVKNIPQNAEICIINGKEKINFFSISRLLGSTFIEMCKIKTLKLRYLLGFQRDSLLIENKIKEIMKKYSLNSSEVTLYSWWFMSGAYACSQLKKRDQSLKVVSRAHRYDLYLEEGIQPFKNDILSNIDYVLACSKQGSDYLKTIYPKFKEKIFYSYLGTINNNVQLKNNPENIIVSCSYIRPVKRIDLIINSLSKFNKESGLKWIHIGSGEDLDKYKLLAEKKLKIDYQFMGHLSNELVFEFFKQENVKSFINLSSSEGLPVSMMEVQSFGIPVVATNVGGVSEIVNNQTGILVSANPTSEEVFKAVSEIIYSSREKYEQLQRNSQSHWNTYFNAEINYKEFIRNYLK